MYSRFVRISKIYKYYLKNKWIFPYIIEDIKISILNIKDMVGVIFIHIFFMIFLPIIYFLFLTKLLDLHHLNSTAFISGFFLGITFFLIQVGLIKISDKEMSVFGAMVKIIIYSSIMSYLLYLINLPTFTTSEVLKIYSDYMRDVIYFQSNFDKNSLIQLYFSTLLPMLPTALVSYLIIKNIFLMFVYLIPYIIYSVVLFWTYVSFLQSIT